MRVSAYFKDVLQHGEMYMVSLSVNVWLDWTGPAAGPMKMPLLCWTPVTLSTLALAERMERHRKDESVGCCSIHEVGPT
jgi:hypothetical protein